MAQGFYRVNNNGVVRQGSFNPEDFDSILETLFKESDFPSLLSTPRKIVRFNKAECSSDFPPSSKWVDEDKVLNFEVAATGCTEEDIFVEVKDGVVTVQFQRDQADKERLYSQQGLRLPTNETLHCKFNNVFHNPNTTEVTLKNGILKITMQPREEMKPITKAVFGKRKESPVEEEKENS